MSDLLARLLASAARDGTVADVRVGAHWTLVAIETPAGLRAGLASTQLRHEGEHGQATVRDAGLLTGRGARQLAEWAGSERVTERSIGFAALNALIEVDEARCKVLNAEELIIERGAGRRVVIVGHFPFTERVRSAVGHLSVLEIDPQEGDLPASAAPDVIPQADVVAITGMTLVNGTFESLAALRRPDAFMLLLGATTPLSPVLFDYGVDAISGTVVDDIALAAAAVSQGASFRQIKGKRLVTMLRE
jgi:uncharacterized protein (DUF4213/DUF364 family)